MNNSINLKNKLTDRIIYNDINGSKLESGNLVLFINMPLEFKNGYKYSYIKFRSNYQEFEKYSKSTIAIFHRDPINKCVKFFLSIGKNKAFVKTIYDENIKNFLRKDNISHFNFPCIKGDFWKNNEDFKKITNYYDAINAYNKFYPISNK